MAIESEIFKLGPELNERDIRICVIDGVRHAVVMEVVKAIGSYINPGQTWKRLRQTRSDLSSKCAKYRFPENPEKVVDVADSKTILDIVLSLPGKTAAEYRRTAIETLLQCLDPTEEFIEQLEQRREHIAVKRPNMLLVSSEDKITSLAAKAYNETYLYIRAYRSEHYTRDTDVAKPLTLDVLKFGITDSLNKRNTQYQADNGFFVFSYKFHTRCEAEIIEKIMRVNFSNITVYDSFEYVNVKELAELLKIIDYTADDYESYIRVADHLLRYAVRLTRLIWPERYDSKATVYSINESPKMAQARLTNKLMVVHEPLQTELRYAPQDYELNDEDLLGVEAARYQQLLKAEKKLHFATHRKVLDLQLQLDQLTGKTGTTIYTPEQKADARRNGEELPKVADRRSKGKIIGRDLVTGEEIVYSSRQKAADACGYTPTAMTRTIIDKKRQLCGKHWRTEGTPYWIPMENFHYDPTKIEKNSGGYIKAINAKDPSDFRVYESQTAAQTALNIGSIKDALRTGKPYSGFFWSHIHEGRDEGMWSNELHDVAHTNPNLVLINGTNFNAEKHIIETNVEIVDDGKDGRCNGKIIARNLKSGEDTIYVSANKASAYLDISLHAMRETFVDKPRQAKGFHFRSFDAKQMWNPPDYLIYDDTGVTKKTKGYVIHEDDNGNKAMYESIKSAGIFTDTKQDNISYCIAHRRGGWRMAEEPEYNTFVDVE